MRGLSKGSLILPRAMGLGAMLTVLVAVACGAAATAPPLPPKAAPPLAAQPPAAQPSAPAAPAVGAKPAPVVIATPTPVPAAPAAPVVHPGKLNWMIGGWGNERFDYNFGAGGVGNNYARILHGFLIATNEKNELLPGIATKWEVSADGKTWTVTIRDGGKFHDGQDITAEDVRWHWTHAWGKDASGSAAERSINSAGLLVARTVEKIELTAHNQVSITRKSPDPGFVTTYFSEAGPGWLGVLPRRPKAHDDAQEAAYDKNPIGAGLAKLVRHLPAYVMKFERFDEYYYQPKKGLPEDRRLKFKSLDLWLVPEEATRVAAIRVGEADIAPASLAARKQVEMGGGRLVFGTEGTYLRVLTLGCWKPQYPCHDKRVRQAMDLAIDKTVMRDKLFGPEVFEAKGWSVITPSTIGYSSDLDPWPQDLAKARQLLADAGYPGGRGFGKVIVNTWNATSIPFLPESAQLAADFWRRELGLDVEVKVGDEAAMKRDRESGKLDGQVMWEDDQTRREVSGRHASQYLTPGHISRVHEDPALFQLTKQTLEVNDPAKRDEAFNKLHKRLREETYHLGIGYVNIPWAVGPRVAAWQPWPLSFYPSNLHGIVLKAP